ncbi:hypothetical protein D3C80_1338430 [compost metagenome]
MLASALLPRHTAEVQASVAVRQRCLVQVDGLSTVDQADNWALTDAVQNVCIADVDQAVWAFYRRVRLGPTFGAQDRHVSHGVPLLLIFGADAEGELRRPGCHLSIAERYRVALSDGVFDAGEVVAGAVVG